VLFGQFDSFEGSKNSAIKECERQGRIYKDRDADCHLVQEEWDRQ